ncbi:shikimate dehydrogenase (NADP(+)) [Thiohalobacter sp. COW1]|uniref:shikimate dehydrogenase n=1 Tax=Thiohalobacter sp. COW1 TaxID=2795687 RepID=UPI00193654B0|nr:shikimate dehydrogenase [Thiohalobacter sp. COW1]BCO32369.1 shikimate dehydrogenase (NADP(+)) [Thiohalobacter sp. COW1]
MSMADTAAPPDRYAVMGNPIDHSKSPQIHTLFARQTHQHLVYEAIRVEPGHLATAIALFRQAGGQGLNITVPFKQDAWRLAEVLNPRAERAGAVNTLLWGNDGRLIGDNTDGIGLVRDLTQNLQQVLTDRRILLLGAGGAARGVIGPLLETHPAGVRVANRTADKARELARLFEDAGNIEGSGFEDLADSRFDLIINATAAGLDSEVPAIPTSIIGEHCCCYDLMYASQPTAFVQWARNHGAALAMDGLGMLVEQAAESFYLWRGLRPDTPPVIAALRSGL